MSLSTTFLCLLKTYRDGDFLGHLFQPFRTLSAKKFLLISNLNLPWWNLRPLPLTSYLLLPGRTGQHSPCYSHTYNGTEKTPKPTNPPETTHHTKARKIWEGKRQLKLYFQLLFKTSFLPLQKLVFAFTDLKLLRNYSLGCWAFSPYALSHPQMHPTLRSRDKRLDLSYHIY